MNSNVDRMISSLTPAIEEKCEELQTARKERLQSRLFVLLCAMVVLILMKKFRMHRMLLNLTLVNK